MVFFSILDRNKGGYFKINPLNNGLVSKQQYEADTNVLITTFSRRDEDVFSITDFLPMTSEKNVYFSEIHRKIQTYADISVEIEFGPFKKEERNRMEKFPGKGFMVYSGKTTQYLSTDIPLDIEDGIVRGVIDLPASHHRWLVTTYGLRGSYSVSSFLSEERLWQTIKYWKRWLTRSSYRGMYHDLVNRSLLTLKGLFFDPTGFMVAAPTTSLPETIGGSRNWDYRFMWIRDTTYVIEAFLRLGYVEEARKFFSAIIDRFERDGRLFSVYPISDDSKIEETLVDLTGYMGSKPVRIGNGAYGQLQIDQCASLVMGLRLLIESNSTTSIHTIEKVYLVGEYLSKIWTEADSSIWEIRGEKRNYVYSKALTWKAFIDLSWLFSKMGANDLASKYAELADTVKNQLYSRGISKNAYFSQSYDSEEIDSSLLRLPLIGFCDFREATYQRTLKEIEKRLMKEDFLFSRYTSRRSELKGRDNAFLMISFWYIRNLIGMGKLSRAYEGIIRIKSILNDLGLMPEEIEFDTHRYLGNYPQALSHLSFILTLIEYNSEMEKIKTVFSKGY